MSTPVHTLVFSCCGVTIRVEVAPRFTDALEGILPPGSVTCAQDGTPHRYAITEASTGFACRRGPRIVWKTCSIAEAVEWLRKSLLLCVAENAPGLIFVHAGAVAINETALIVPGRSRSGKSTLVRALLDSGAGYCSDEFAVFDQDGNVHPFPVPIGIRSPSGDTIRTICSENQIVHGTIRPSVLLFATYKPRASWAPKALTPANVLLQLLRNTVAIRNRPKETLRTLRTVAEACCGYGGTRGEVDRVVEWISFDQRLDLP